MRLAALTAFLVIGWGVAAQAAPRVQFDLVCTGTIKDAGVPEGSGHAWNDRVAVDLAAGSYCEGMCEAPRPLAAVEPGFIFFEGGRGPDGQVPIDHGFAVNRMNGDIYKRDAVSSASGKCRPDKFTPFSHRLF
jgi:hypothetical protein